MNDSTKNINSALNPTVKKLGAVSFFADVASEMLYPITPIFLTTVLGASMSSLGAIEGCAEAIASLLKTYSGSWSDRLEKRKPFVIAGYFLGAISKPLIGISSTWTHVLLARGLDRTGKGIRSAPRDALIADSVNTQNRGAAFGWHRGMDTLGAAVGPLLTISVLAASPSADNFRQLYWWALIPGMLSVLIAFSVKDKIHNKNQFQNTSASTVSKQKWQFKNFDPNFKKYLFAWTIFSLMNSSDVFLLLRAKNSGASTTTVVLLYCAYNLVYALSSPYLGKLSDSLPRKYLMAFGLAVYSLVYLGFGLASETWQYCILFLIYGLYMGATDGIGKALAVDYSPRHLKATALGILGTVTGFSTIIASSSAGYIWDHFGAQYTFFFGAFGALISALILLTLSQKSNPKVEAPNESQS